ncbi:hypothetical protein [Streptomyces sp. NPDC058255]|uniref:hypothetical protein n=1 Tax=Streptomyces sp. NPDC058255 TaxID=3346407 RepID=UPI0036EE192C
MTSSSFLVLGVIGTWGEARAYDVTVEAARTVAPFWSAAHAQVYAIARNPRCIRVPWYLVRLLHTRFL